MGTEAMRVQAEGQEARLSAAFLREQRTGLRLLAGARIVALLVIVVFLLGIDRDFVDPATYAVILALAATAPLAWWAQGRNWYRPWMLYALVAADQLLLGWGIFGAVISGQDPVPPALYLRTEWFAIFFLFIGATALTLSPTLVVWSGACATAVWATAALWVMAQPGSRLLRIHLPPEGDIAAFLAEFQAPEVVNPVAVCSQILLLALTTFTLAVAVRRSRRVVAAQAAAERERANLARYFSPDMVDRLASMDSPLAQAQTRPVAVMFADLVGFTRLCEQEPPDAVIDLLRGFRARMERCVFANGGTIDKYVGDCVMVTFGTLQTSPQDAASSLACALDMVQAVETWNREREAEGRPLLRLGIGIHYGEALLGDIGGERQMEFTVIGDTVNVASRLEKITRDLGADIVVSDDLARAAQAAVGEGILRSFQKAEAVALRGRSGSIGVWYHARVDQLAA